MAGGVPYVQPQQQPGLPQDPAMNMMMTPMQTPPTDSGTPEGGGTSGNANLPGNDAPSEGMADSPGTSLTTKPRQMPSGGQQAMPGMAPGMAPGMGQPGMGMAPGQQQAGQPSPSGGSGTADGGADMMTQQSMPKGMSYARKHRAMVAEVLAANPGLPHERAVVIARRALALPGVLAADDDSDGDDLTSLPRPDGQAPGAQERSSGGGGGGLPGVPGLPGAAEGGEAAGLSELLPLAMA